MIILPNTPPIPKGLAVASDVLPSHISSTRASLSSSPIEAYNDLVRYVVNLEQYVEELFEFAKRKLGANDMLTIIEFSGAYKLSTSNEPPWQNVSYNQALLNELSEAESDACQNDSSSNDRVGNLKMGDLKLNDFKVKVSTDKLRKKLKVFNSNKLDWVLLNELEISIVATTLIYTRLGAELINELIELELDDQNISLAEVNEKWKQVISFYKQGISFVKLAQQINNEYTECNHLNGELLIFLEKINNISIQMSILCKSSWLNRNSYNENESFKTTNNGTLCRVAIFVVDELKTADRILINSTTNKYFLIRLQTDNWMSYLKIIERYTIAYAGLFLSIETYQQDRLGQAIGLLNFSLLSLQSKNISELNPTKHKLITKFKSKFSYKRNEHFIKSLESITSLNLNNSLFNEKSGIILKDLNYLFDQLVQLRLKFSKENDNLKFDKVTDYQDLHKDNKWPLGSQIPINDIPAYIPKCMNNEHYNGKDSSTSGTSDSSNEISLYPGRGSYY